VCGYEEGVKDSAGPPGPDPAVSEPADRAVEPGVQPAAPDRGWGPAALLRPEREIVRFGGRVEERSALRDWCAGMAPHSVRVLVGEAGIGKTRLARRAGGDWGAQAEPWRVVEPGDEPLAAAAIRAGVPGRPLLIVDEAESRAGLPELLEAALTGPGEARVLLAARSLGDWWELLAEDCPPGVARLLTEAPPLRLGRPLSPAATDADVAAAAVPHFAAAMSLELRGKPEVERAAMRLPVLLLHTAALLALLRSAVDGQAPFRLVITPGVLDELLEHELRYWQATAAAAGLPHAAEPLAHAVTVATLAGPLSVEEAEPVLARVPALTGETAEHRLEWAHWLGGLYPPGPNGHLGGLRPDLVAETLVVRQLAGDPVLARSFLRALPPGQAVHAVSVLAWAAERDREAAGVLGAALNYDLPQLAGPAALVAQQVPGELPALLGAALGNAPAAAQALADIARGLPRPSRSVAGPELTLIMRAREALAATGAGDLTEWDDRAAEVLRWLDGQEAAQPELGAEPAAGRPRWLGDAADTGPPGQPRRDGGQFGAARSGSDLDGAGHSAEEQAELAWALTNLAVRCAERDRPRDAQLAEQQAVRIYRELAAADPVRYRPELAASLVNLGVWVAGLAGPADAVPPTREAAGILRELADSDPGPYQADLATCLANLGIWYTEAGQPDDALAAERETASILRGLALADPSQYQAELAASLTNLGLSYSRAGRPAEADPVEREAVSIRRELAAAGPDAAGPDLAAALTNLAITQAELGRPEEAAEAAQDAVTVYRDLAAADPARHRRDLARALASLGARLGVLGEAGAAVEALGEAVSIRRGLAATDPERNRPGLVRALDSLAAALAGLGRREEADAVLAEAELVAAAPGPIPAAGPGPAAGAEPRSAPGAWSPTSAEPGLPADGEPEQPAGSESGQPAASGAPRVPAQRRGLQRAPEQGRMPTAGS
jgi:tetratricopeptide (TPR) repeat protein